MNDYLLSRLRAALADSLEASFHDLDRFLRLQALVDALDRLNSVQHNLRSPTSARWNNAEQTAVLGAIREFQEALTVVSGSIETELRESGEQVLQAAIDAFEEGSRSTRSGRPDTAAKRKASQSAPSADDPAGGRIPAAIPVRFGASAPAAVAPGARFVAHLVAYREGDVDAGCRLLGGQGALDVGNAGIAHGTAVDVVLSGEGLEVEGGQRASQRFLWTGRPIRIDFEVQAKGFKEQGSTVLRFDVQVDGIVLARVRLQLAISPKSNPEIRFSAEERFVAKAFASYSSKDRERVIDRVAAIRIAAKVDVFLDCHDLNPSDAWHEVLAERIDDCDTFMLFWSDDAALSPWVKWEWKRALHRPGIERMQLHPLQNGVEPPPELASIHMGDAYMDLRAAERLRRTTAR